MSLTENRYPLRRENGSADREKDSDLILRSIAVATGRPQCVSKDGGKSGACGHPSRRSHASACDLLRMRTECVAAPTRDMRARKTPGRDRGFSITLQKRDQRAGLGDGDGAG